MIVSKNAWAQSYRKGWANAINAIAAVIALSVTGGWLFSTFFLQNSDYWYRPLKNR